MNNTRKVGWFTLTRCRVAVLWRQPLQMTVPFSVWWTCEKALTAKYFRSFESFLVCSAKCISLCLEQFKRNYSRWKSSCPCWLEKYNKIVNNGHGSHSGGSRFEYQYQQKKSVSTRSMDVTTVAYSSTGPKY